MNEFIAALLQAVLIAAVPVLAAFVGKGISAIASYLGQKSENEAVKKYLAAVADAVSTAVTYTSQTYVDALKKSGEFTKENQEEALSRALDKAKTLLTQEAIEYLEAAYGSLERYLEGRILHHAFRQRLPTFRAKRYGAVREGSTAIGTVFHFSTAFPQ